MGKFRCVCGRVMSNSNPNPELKNITDSQFIESEESDEPHGDIISLKSNSMFICTNCNSIYIKWNNERNKYSRYIFDIGFDKLPDGE